MHIQDYTSAKAFIKAALAEGLITQNQVDLVEAAEIAGIAAATAADINANIAAEHTPTKEKPRPDKCQVLSATMLSQECVRLIGIEQQNRLATLLRKIPVGHNYEATLILKDYFNRFHKATPTDFAMLCHHMQQIKRSLHNIPTADPTLWLVYGASGLGKTTWIKNLLKPFIISRTCLQMSMNELLDPKIAGQFAKNYVAFPDELPKLDKKDYDAFKSISTAKTRDYRPLYSSATVQITNKIQGYFAGINTSMAVQSQDSTSSRRFYEVKFVGDQHATEATKYKVWLEIEEFDPIELWSAIDVNKDYLEGHHDVITDAQEAWKAEDIIKSFLAEFNIQPGKERLDMHELYESFRIFSERAGVKNLKPKNTFSRELAAMDYKIDKHKATIGQNAGSTSRCISIDKDSFFDKMTGTKLALVKEEVTI